MNALSTEAVARYRRDGFYFPVRVLSSEEAGQYRARLEAVERAPRPPVAHRDTFAPGNLLSRGQEIMVEVDEARGVDIVLHPGDQANRRSARQRHARARRRRVPPFRRRGAARGRPRSGRAGPARGDHEATGRDPLPRDDRGALQVGRHSTQSSSPRGNPCQRVGMTSRAGPTGVGAFARHAATWAFTTCSVAVSAARCVLITRRPGFVRRRRTLSAPRPSWSPERAGAGESARSRRRGARRRPCRTRSAYPCPGAYTIP